MKFVILSIIFLLGAIFFILDLKRIKKDRTYFEAERDLKIQVESNKLSEKDRTYFEVQPWNREDSINIGLDDIGQKTSETWEIKEDESQI
jgi:hypothetical protein